MPVHSRKLSMHVCSGPKRLELRAQKPTWPRCTRRFMGSYKNLINWVNKPLMWVIRYSYSYPTYKPTYNYPWNSKWVQRLLQAVQTEGCDLSAVWEYLSCIISLVTLAQEAYPECENHYLPWKIFKPSVSLGGICAAVSWRTEDYLGVFEN